MHLEAEEFRPITRVAERLIEKAKAERLAAFGNNIPEGWPQAVRDAFPDVWRYWPSVPSGWIDICMALSEHLRETAPGAMVEDSKEKFGAMRVQVTGDEHMPEIAFDISSVYEVLSTRICQDCGEPGKLRRDRGWHATLCDKHAEERAP